MVHAVEQISGDKKELTGIAISVQKATASAQMRPLSPKLFALVKNDTKSLNVPS